MTSGSESSSFATPYHDQVVNKHFYQYEYQQLYLSVLLFILPLYNSFLFIFPQKCKNVLYCLHLTVKDRVQVHNEEVKSTLRKAKREQLIQFTVSAINLNRRATNMIGLNSKISQCYGSTKNPVTRTKSFSAEIRIRQGPCDEEKKNAS